MSEPNEAAKVLEAKLWALPISEPMAGIERRFEIIRQAIDTATAELWENIYTITDELQDRNKKIRDLETQLSEAQNKINALYDQMADKDHGHACESAALSVQIAEAQAEIERLRKTQMRVAELESAIESECCHLKNATPPICPIKWTLADPEHRERFHGRQALAGEPAGGDEDCGRIHPMEFCEVDELAGGDQAQPLQRGSGSATMRKFEGDVLLAGGEKEGEVE